MGIDLATDPQTQCLLHLSSAHRATDEPTLAAGLLFCVSVSCAAPSTDFEIPWYRLYGLSDDLDDYSACTPFGITTQDYVDYSL